MSNLVAGSVALASWDVWWRSAYHFSQNVPATGNTPYLDRDLGLTIMSDDDGLITDMFTRFTSGTNFSGVTSVGQTFIARGVNLISAAFWLADGTFPGYVVRLLENAPGGAQIGTTKR